MNRAIINGIIFGVGAPNLTRDGDKTRCAIILDDEIGFVRVYPIPATEKFPIWHRVRAVVERSRSDTRKESFKLLSFDVGSAINPRDKRSILDACVLRPGACDPIAFQNEKKASIVLVKLGWGTAAALLAQRVPSIGGDDGDEGWVRTQSTLENKPYLVWQGGQGGEHRTHLVGHEVYMGLIHNPDKPFDIFYNLRINDPEYEHWLLLGNMKNRRSVWVGVHVHRLKKKEHHADTQSSLVLGDGKPAGWPYSEQVEEVAPIVVPQLEMFTTANTGAMRCPGSMATTNS